MARITVNETGSNPMILVSTANIANLTTANIANGNLESSAADTLSIGCLQDVTITASTGVFSWTDFCSTDTNKITTPADNEVATNVVIDNEKYFGSGSGSAGAAANVGIASLSQNKTKVQFIVIWNSNGSSPASGTANVAALLTTTTRNTLATTADPIYWSSGVGYITNLAPTVSPDAPVWVSPMTIAVDGTLYNGQNT
jgi:hypothetical protein